MKRFVIILIIIVVLALSVMSIFSRISRGLFSSRYEKFSQEEIFNGNKVDTLDISTVSADVNFHTVNSGKIKIKYFNNVRNRMFAPKLDAKLHGSTLNVKIERRKSLFNFNIGIFNYKSPKLDIYIPEDYSENINLKTVSGDVEVGELELSDLKINTVSGDINVNNIKASKNIYTKSTSGDLNINAECRDFSFKSISGDIEGESLITKTSDIRTTSGKVEILEYAGDMKFKSTSGNLFIEYIKFNNNVTTNTVSGNAHIKLSENSEFYIKFSSTSGDVENDFTITNVKVSKSNKLEGTVGSDKNKVEVNSVSGDLRLEKN